VYLERAHPAFLTTLVVLVFFLISVLQPFMNKLTNFVSGFF